MRELTKVGMGKMGICPADLMVIGSIRMNSWFFNIAEDYVDEYRQILP